MDEFTRESLAIEVGYSLPSRRVIEVLERLIRERGCRETLLTDNGLGSRSVRFTPQRTIE